MRKGIGIAGIKQRETTNNIIKQTLGTEVSQFQNHSMREKIEFFKTKLEEFAREHKNDINKDPQFRHYFHTLCLKIGVDPLASSKGFWSELLGVGDFYYELGVQIIEVCIKTRNQNGGLMDLTELTHRLEKKTTISRDDIIQAIKAIKPLGNGFCIIKIGDREYIQSVPCELSNDHLQICTIAKIGYTTLDEIKTKTGWNQERIVSTLHTLMQESIIWVDDQAENRVFYFPGLIEMN
jgi:ESCRT-II complex subunit VPS22